jgi:hypothetical protein
MAHWRLVISASDQQESNNIAGEDLFFVQLSASGEEPATHYWCGIDQGYKDRIVPQFSSISSLQLFSYDTYTRQQTLDDTGMKRIDSGTPPPPL